MRNVYATARHAVILDTIRRSGYVRIGDLIEKLDVSPVTVHRDLDYLAKTNSLKRVRGGARSFEHGTHEIKTDYVLREAQAPALKYQIAEFARAKVENGTTIFLDASTTAFALALALERNPPIGLTVVTNSNTIAFHLRSPKIKLIVVPGEIDQSMRAIAGTWTIKFLESMHFTIAFISAAGISLTAGLTTSQKSLADISETVLNRSDTSFALLDSTKFGTTALIPLAKQAKVTSIITDDSLSASEIMKYREAGWPISTPSGGK